MDPRERQLGAPQSSQASATDEVADGDAANMAIRSEHILARCLKGVAPKQDSLTALALEVLCRSPQIELSAEAGVVRRELHPQLALAETPVIAHGEGAPSELADVAEGWFGWSSSHDGEDVAPERHPKVPRAERAGS